MKDNIKLIIYKKNFKINKIKKYFIFLKANYYLFFTFFYITLIIMNFYYIYQLIFKLFYILYIKNIPIFYFYLY